MPGPYMGGMPGYEMPPEMMYTAAGMGVPGMMGWDPSNMMMGGAF